MFYRCTLIEAVEKPDVFFDAVDRRQEFLKERQLPPEVVGEFILALKRGLAFCAAADYPFEKIQILADGGDVESKKGENLLKAATIVYHGSVYAGIILADSLDWRTYHRESRMIPCLRYARIDFGPGIDQNVRKLIREIIADFGLRYEYPFIQLA